MWAHVSWELHGSVARGFVAANVSEIRVQAVMKYALKCLGNHMLMHSRSHTCSEFRFRQNTRRIFQHGAKDLWRIECGNDGKPSWCGCAKWFHHFDGWELSNKDPAATNQVFPNFRYFGWSPGLKFQVWKVCCDGWHGSLESKVDRFQWFVILMRDESKDPFGGSLCWQII